MIEFLKVLAGVQTAVIGGLFITVVVTSILLISPGNMHSMFKEKKRTIARAIFFTLALGALTTLPGIVLIYNSSVIFWGKQLYPIIKEYRAVLKDYDNQCSAKINTNPKP